MRAVSIFSGALLASIVAPSVLAPAVAAADSVEATRYEVVERSHVVDLKVDRGFATLVVQRTVANLGPKSDQAVFHLSIPDTSVATRLRTSGVNASGQTLWFEGELMEAEAAAKKYQELTGIGGYYPKDPALLSWRHQGELALQVFPVPAQSTKTVEYTLKMPLTYEDGAYHLDVPPLGTEALWATVHVSAAHPEDDVSVNGVIASSGAPAGGAPVITARAEKALRIDLRPRNVAPVETALASVPIAAGKNLVRGRIAAAPHVAEVPAGAHVVVLFDGSVSHHDAPAGLTAIRAYLGHMTGATVDFLTFDREVRAPIGRTLPVRTALSKLSDFQLELHNGSRIDDALQRADAILQASPAQNKRVVVVTDTLTRSELTPAKFGAATWKSGAIVHVAVVRDQGATSLVRDDDSPWAMLPRRTGGLFWTASASAGLIDVTSRSTFEELARPKRIDKLLVKGLTGAFVAPDMLEEGNGLEHFVVADAPSTSLEVTGELWSKAIRFVATPNAEQNKLAAALTFGSGLWNGLSEPEQMKLAVLGGAVSPVTSYLAIEPGVRPSTEGLDWGATGIGSGIGSGQGFGSGHGRLSGHGPLHAIDKNVWLEKALHSALAMCSPTSQGATAHLESTLEEVVDVGVIEIAPTRDTKAESCIREAMWGLSLPASAFKDDFEAHVVKTKL